MARRKPIEVGEWYHCYSRGVEKRKVFENEHDARRFLMLLYLANGTRPVSLFSERKPHVEKAFNTERGRCLVSIGAYCLMPNHFHLLLKEINEGGIASFMQKLGTAYTMYFNAKHERVGGLFVKPFRSRHVGTDRYFQRVIQYIHCNPAELYEPQWKLGKVRDIRKLEEKLLKYPYSSIARYCGNFTHDPILSEDGLAAAEHPKVSRMLIDARSYYEEATSEKFER